MNYITKLEGYIFAKRCVIIPSMAFQRIKEIIKNRHDFVEKTHKIVPNIKSLFKLRSYKRSLKFFTHIKTMVWRTHQVFNYADILSLPLGVRVCQRKFQIMNHIFNLIDMKIKMGLHNIHFLVFSKMKFKQFVGFK